MPQTRMINFRSNETRATRVARASLIALAVAAAAAFNPLPARASAAAGSFTLVQPMNQFRRQQTATLLLDGRVLVAGGTPFLKAATSEIYDPLAETWTTSGPLAAGREFHTATLLQDGRVVVTGGFVEPQVLA